MNISARVLSLAALLALPVGVMAKISVSEEEAKAVDPVSSIQDKANTIVEEVAKIRGLEVKRDLVAAALSRKQLEANLIDKIDRSMIDIDVKYGDAIMGRLGVYPGDVNTKELVIKVLRQSVGGYYDDQDKRLYVIKGQNNDTSDATMAHELTHGLQDQHFYLESMPHRTGTSDLSTALRCVIEGDAKWTELNYMQSKVGKMPGARTYLTPVPVGGKYLGEIEDQSQKFMLTMYIKQMFPYIGGTQFVKEVYDRGGWDAVNRLYNDYPISMEMILHPEKYMDPNNRDYPVEIVMHDFVDWLDGDYMSLMQDTLGEANVAQLWASHLPRSELDCEKAAAGWDGDTLIGFVRKDNKKPGYVWLSRWDSEDDAREFADGMKKLYQHRFEAPKEGLPAEVVAQDGEVVCWVEQQGANVLVVDGESLANTKTLIQKALDSATFTEYQPKKFWKAKAEHLAKKDPVKPPE